MSSISSGHSAEYLTSQVAAGRESYYLDATTAGEAPGRWWGGGAQAFGLAGEVNEADMEDLYSRFYDPRDPHWSDPATRDQCARLGVKHGRGDGVRPASLAVVGEASTQRPVIPVQGLSGGNTRITEHH
jgi:hypothetical protein